MVTTILIRNSADTTDKELRVLMVQVLTELKKAFDESAARDYVPGPETAPVTAHTLHPESEASVLTTRVDKTLDRGPGNSAIEIGIRFKGGNVEDYQAAGDFVALDLARHAGLHEGDADNWPAPEHYALVSKNGDTALTVHSDDVEKVRQDVDEMLGNLRELVAEDRKPEPSIRVNVPRWEKGKPAAAAVRSGRWTA